jgi:hypothetical protein
MRRRIVRRRGSAGRRRVSRRRVVRRGRRSGARRMRIGYRF